MYRKTHTRTYHKEMREEEEEVEVEKKYLNVNKRSSCV